MASATENQPFSYTITVDSIASSLSVGGLASIPGLSFDAATGLISGSPSQAGTFTLGLAASNPGGTGSAALIITVGDATPPVITASSPSAVEATGPPAPSLHFRRPLPTPSAAPCQFRRRRRPAAPSRSD
jgi:hypothetical protein